MKFVLLYQLCAYSVLLTLSKVYVSAKMELKLLSVLSINKFYVPDYNYLSPEFKVPKNLTYEYFTSNAVDVPNSVKLDLFGLGVSLRKTYDRFLGSLYTEPAMLMRTTEYPVSIIAGELINAGLWPPVGPQIWKEDLPWQPIPFEYKPATEDAVLLGTLCPTFKLETSRVLSERDDLTGAHVQLVSRLHDIGIMNISTLLDVPSLYFTLENAVELNRTLPQWASSVFPGQGLLNATLAAYELLSQTKAQRQLNGGALVKLLLQDFHEADERKISVFSGDDRLLAGVSRILGVPAKDVPAAGAALIFELHADDDDERFVKIMYYTGGKDAEFFPYPVGCGIFCPMRNFTELVADSLPGDGLALCRGTNHSTDGPRGSSSVDLGVSNYFLLIPVLSVALPLAVPGSSRL
ncbi:venom acid phosphatase Acph-1-like [Copidosoma floridanum]|uniref:venom acid phosphatase Acph-1-like n=1 Tax=Copidosoma floridanum TaxID=29053 RepID=UPI0006C9407F|nr:venom acid phosphatase Acph-1-like [Copidosoma floridanum]